jgi:hypothetical protein
VYGIKSPHHVVLAKKGAEVVGVKNLPSPLILLLPFNGKTK